MWEREENYIVFQNSVNYFKKSVHDIHLNFFATNTLIHSVILLFLWHANFLQSMEVIAFIALLEQNTASSEEICLYKTREMLFKQGAAVVLNNISLRIWHFWMPNSSNRYLTRQSTGETERITKRFLWQLPISKVFINRYCLSHVLFEILCKISSRKCYKMLFRIAGQIKSCNKIFKVYFRNSIESLKLDVLWFLSVTPLSLFLWNLQQENLLNKG